MWGQASWCPSGRTFAGCSDPGGHRVGSGPAVQTPPLCGPLGSSQPGHFAVRTVFVFLLHFYSHDMKENKYRLMKVKESSPG